MRYQSKDLAVTAFRYRGSPEDFICRIASVLNDLRVKWEMVPVGRLEVLAFFLCSNECTWRLVPGDYLVVFKDKTMEVMNQQRLDSYFERKE